MMYGDILLYVRDLEVALNKIVPGSWTRDGTFLHTMEGEDDMPGHVKSSLMGPSLNIPVSILYRYAIQNVTT